MGNTAWEHDWWEHCLVSTFWGHCLGALPELPLHKEHDLGVHVVLTNGIELVVLPRGPLESMAAQLLIRVVSGHLSSPAPLSLICPTEKGGRGAVHQAPWPQSQGHQHLLNDPIFHIQVGIEGLVIIHYLATPDQKAVTLGRRHSRAGPSGSGQPLPDPVPQWPRQEKAQHQGRAESSRGLMDPGARPQGAEMARLQRCM